jgi:hypothetical protein
MPIVLPPVGETKTATISRIERSKAGDVFTNKKTGEFSGKYSKPTDLVYVIHGKVAGIDQEIKLGTVNAPKHGVGSKLLQLALDAGFKGNAILSDDLHELVGKTVHVVIDDKGYTRLKF